MTNSISKDVLRDEGSTWLINCTTKETWTIWDKTLSLIVSAQFLFLNQAMCHWTTDATVISHLSHYLVKIILWDRLIQWSLIIYGSHRCVRPTKYEECNLKPSHKILSPHLILWWCSWGSLTFWLKKKKKNLFIYGRRDGEWVVEQVSLKKVSKRVWAPRRIVRVLKSFWYTYIYIYIYVKVEYKFVWTIWNCYIICAWMNELILGIIECI